MELSRTGIFVPVDKATLLLGTASPSLQSICRVRAVIGTTRTEDKHCEILLLPLSSQVSQEDFMRAVGILGNYVNLLVNNLMVNNKSVVQHADVRKNMSKTVTDNRSRISHVVCKGKLKTGLSHEETICLDDSLDISFNNLPRDSSSVSSQISNNKGLILPARISPVQSPTVSNTDDVIIVDLVSDIKNLNNNKRLEPADSIFSTNNNNNCNNSISCSNSISHNNEVSGRKFDNSEDDDIICLEKQDVTDVKPDNEEDADILSLTDLSEVELVDDNNSCIFSENNISETANSSFKNRFQIIRTSRRRKNSKKKKTVFNYAKKQSSNVKVPNSMNSDSKSSEYVLVEKNINSFTAKSDVKNSLRLVSNSNNIIPPASTDKECENKKDDEELSVIELECSDYNNDEIILISENEDSGDNNVENDCKKKDNVSEQNSVISKSSPKKRKNKRKRFKRKPDLVQELRKLTREELEERGYVIDPPNCKFPPRLRYPRSTPFATGVSSLSDRVNVTENNVVVDPSLTSLNSDSVLLAAVCKNSNQSLKLVNHQEKNIKTQLPSANTAPANIMWTRPAHMFPHNPMSKDSMPDKSNFTPCAVNAASLSGAPLIVRGISMQTTLNKKRHIPVQAPDDSSPVKKAKVDNIGSNVSVPDDSNVKKTGLRPVVIDACNVAFSHGRNADFSVKGLEICIKYFKSRGHRVIAILPNFRKGMIQDKVLKEWENDGTLVFTPSRKVNGQLVVSHDDRFIIQCAAALEGVIVSQDHYRDFIGQNDLWDDAIKKRLLMFTWIGDLLMFPEDPLGRNGPSLDTFLRFPSSTQSSTTTSSST